MTTNDYIRGALDDVDTTARRIPMYVEDKQPVQAAYASHVVQGRFAEVALLTHLRRLDPELADKLAAWIGEVQGDRERMGEILSRWGTEAFTREPFTVFGPEEA